MEFSDAERIDRAYLRIAMLIRSLWEETGTSDTRLLDCFLIPDTLTVVGQSLAASPGDTCREHVVPRLWIIRECHRRLGHGASDHEIARLIRDNLKIVKISKEERSRLDRTTNLGLRQKMPIEWSFGGDIFARLQAAGIQWSPMPVETIAERSAAV